MTTHHDSGACDPDAPCPECAADEALCIDAERGRIGCVTLVPTGDTMPPCAFPDGVRPIPVALVADEEAWLRGVEEVF